MGRLNVFLTSVVVKIVTFADLPNSHWTIFLFVISFDESTPQAKSPNQAEKRKIEIRVSENILAVTD